tara:strand:+ start:391 stop:612 length:222 start_codon:yes stop_codon:yes gene_type:complete
MTVTEMITRFEKNMKELVEEIRELDTTLTAKKEEFFRLQGAIEGLKMAKQQEDGGEVDLDSGKQELISQHVEG